MSWADLEDEMSDGLTEEFGVAIRHVPMARSGDVNARPIADPDRPAQTLSARVPTKALQGIFSWPHRELEILKGQDRSRTQPAAIHSSRNPTLSVDERDLANQVHENDQFVIVAKNLTFSVIDPQPDGEGRIVMELNQVGRSGVKS